MSISNEAKDGSGAFHWSVQDNDGRQRMIGPVGDPTKASISIAASGDNSVIAAPGVGNKIRILGLWAQNTDAASTTVILKDNATAINGAGWVIVTNGFLPIIATPLTPLDLGNNAPFVINLSAAHQLSGIVVYTVEAV